MSGITFDPPFHYQGIRFGPWVTPAALHMVENFEVRDDDVFVSAYVRSGTTWTQQIACLVVAEGDLSEVNKVPLLHRAPWLETYEWETRTPIPHLLESAPSPRVIKTHLPYHMLPKQLREGKGKIIYCARNVKDVVVALHKFRTTSSHFPCGTWEENFQEFLTPDQALYGFWWNDIPEYWRHKDDDNLIFNKYEDMKKDLRGHVVKIANFLGKNLSDQRVDEVVANCTFSAMKSNPATNASLNPYVVDAFFDRAKTTGLEYIRKGKVGDWKTWMTVKQNEALEAVHREMMAGIDLSFEFE